MDEDTATPGPASDGADGGDGEEKEIDPDMVEDSFDDVDNL
ncbi:MAG: hypothetical protein AAB699_00215 [Patescibacteria group bacterium]